MKRVKALEDTERYLTNKYIEAFGRIEKLENVFCEMQKHSAVTEDRVDRLEVSHGELLNKSNAYKTKSKCVLFGVAAGAGTFIVCSLSSLIFYRKK